MISGAVHLRLTAAGIIGDGGLPAQRLQQAVHLVLLQGDQRGIMTAGPRLALNGVEVIGWR
ncbi:MULTISPECIES: hypothetical protein [unclassified Arthrobacter]|uniref:hypothetical protein n=1 Tax=unclassified Arthrobacter TaxID=235627 RepID=UPI003398964A